MRLPMRHTRRSTVGLTFITLLCWLRLVLSVDAADAEARRLPTLTRAEQLRGLTAAEARLGHEIRVVGVVTYSDLSRGLLFVQDASGGVFVVPRAQSWDWPV